MNILGIDPGQSGGIAFIGEGYANAYKMPDTERDIFEMLSCECVHTPGLLEGNDFAYIEEVHSMPKQGVASTFKFGVNYGGLRMALIALGIPFETVSPQRWQKALGCLSRGDKNVTKRKAQELFPHLKITHAIADALLIAEFGRRIQHPYLNARGAVPIGPDDEKPEDVIRRGRGG